jgi:hypothetical protein
MVISKKHFLEIWWLCFVFVFGKNPLQKSHIGFLFGSHIAKIRLNKKQNTMKYLDLIGLILKYLIGKHF